MRVRAERIACSANMFIPLVAAMKDGSRVNKHNGESRSPDSAESTHYRSFKIGTCVAVGLGIPGQHALPCGGMTFPASIEETSLKPLSRRALLTIKRRKCVSYCLRPNLETSMGTHCPIMADSPSARGGIHRLLVTK